MTDVATPHEWRRTPRAFWRVPELAVIRAHYADGGIDACEPLLPGRSRVAIYQQASAMGIRSARQKVRVRYAYPIDERIDEQIRMAHQRAPERGDMQRLADRLGRPRWWVTRRARELGLITPRFAEPAWSAEELAIIERTAGRLPAIARKALAEAGFQRSLTAVVVKRKRLEIPVPTPARTHTAAGLATLLGHDRKTVLRWLSDGKLRAADRGNRNLIRERDVRAFLLRHPEQVDLRKLPLMNREWFIRLLATGAANG